MINMISLLIALALLAGVIVLQVFLSKREGRLPGLILPIFFNCVCVAGTLVGYKMVTLLLNIPTVILLVIYAACRENGRQGRNLDKMNILDLE